MAWQIPWVVKGCAKSRYDEIAECVPEDVRDRVFVLGVRDEPEDFRRVLVQENKIRPNTWEQIGEILAVDCIEQKTDVWQHEHLSHNIREIDRVCATFVAIRAV